MRLRDYQEELVAEADPRLRPSCGVMLQCPTGSGKTEMGIAALLARRGAGMCDAWLTHRRELDRQSGTRLNLAGLHTVRMGAFAGPERFWHSKAVTIVSPSLRRWPTPPKGRTGLLVVDEAHHTPAGTWAKLVTQWRAAGGAVLGLTATPWRMSKSQGFSEWYDHLLIGPSVALLQEQGYLARPRVYTPRGAEMQMRKEDISSMGDYLARAMERDAVRMLDHDYVVPAWRQRTARMEDKRTLWFLPTVHSANKMASQLESAAVLTGETPDAEREKVLRALADKRLTHLVSVDVISEGLDIPSVPVVATLRPTLSLVTYLQQCGRGSRPKGADGGEYVLLDYAKNSLEHGVPDTDREWSLLPRSRTSAGGGKPPVARCHHPECDHVMHTATRRCEECNSDQYFVCPSCHVERRWTQYLFDREGIQSACLECRKLHTRVRRTRVKSLKEITSSRPSVGVELDETVRPGRPRRKVAR